MRTIVPMKHEVHEGGIITAVAIAAVATMGVRLTTSRGVLGWDAVWIVAFVAAWLVLSAAAVNFDMKRWLW